MNSETTKVLVESACNEWGPIEYIALREAKVAFYSDSRISRQWRPLRFHSQPEFDAADEEYQSFEALIRATGSNVILLEGHEVLTLDSIYPRDALIVAPQGLVLCEMGRPSRSNEPKLNAAELVSLGFPVLGEISRPGTLEGGDFIWLDERHAAVGSGPRTNQEGISQLRYLLGNDIDLHVVPLPEPEHPEDVFHLMSMISPLDKDLALIYRPLMPEGFMAWLISLGIAFVEVPEDEYLPMGCNVLATGPRQVIMLDRLPETKRKLEQAGCSVTTYKGDEISRKGEGGPTCLTRPLVRRRS